MSPESPPTAEQGNTRRIGDMTQEEFAEYHAALHEAVPNVSVRRLGENADRRSRGREFHLMARARVLRLIVRDAAINSSDILTDADLAEAFPTREQVSRLFDGLVENKYVPENSRDGEVRFRRFAVPWRGINVVFLTTEDRLHCAIPEAFQKKGTSDPVLLAKVREAYHAGSSCIICKPPEADM